MTNEEPEVRFAVEMPVELAGGVYADFVSVSHARYAFTLDFAAVVGPGQPAVDNASGASLVVVPTAVVARVRVPPDQIIEIMKLLNSQLAAWEEETGQQPEGAQDA